MEKLTALLAWDNLKKDIPASISVALVALPLCLGIALASQAGTADADPTPLMAGIIAGIVGGILVGSISGSHTSVSGPAAGLVATVMVALQELESFPLFLMAVFFAGVIQVAMGAFRAGVIAYYFPSSVIRGLLAAIGLILIFKQIPHALGLDKDPEGDFSFMQIDGFNTFTELSLLDDYFEFGAAIIFAICLAIFLTWNRIPALRKSVVPGALIAVITGVVLNAIFRSTGGSLGLEQEHLVSLTTGDQTFTLSGIFQFPSLTVFNQLEDDKIFHLIKASFEIAIIASLETLLNLEACDRLDNQRRVSPPNRELIAQGCGNITCGLIGGLPVTSVVVRSSANVYAGSRSKMSTILHGFWLLLAVAIIPGILMMIPLSALAAILIATGFKLASPTVFKEIFKQGPQQYIPFLATVAGTFFTDLLIGVLIGLGFAVLFLLKSMAIKPFALTQTKPTPGNTKRLVLAQHMSFLSRARVLTELDRVEAGSHIILDASQTDFIDPDILNLFREFIDEKAPLRNIQVSKVGFQEKYLFPNKLTYSDVVTPEWQAAMSPEEALAQLVNGNKRFTNGTTIQRDLDHQRHQTVDAQHPMAAVLGCIDSRVPAEIVFDTGLGSIFAVRVAGNVVNQDVLASLEYAGAAVNVKLIVVLGHSGCGAVRAACEGFKLGHITGLLAKIQPAVEKIRSQTPTDDGQISKEFADAVTKQNVLEMMHEIRQESPILKDLENDGKLAIVGGVYNLGSGVVDFFDSSGQAMPVASNASAAPSTSVDSSAT